MILNKDDVQMPLKVFIDMRGAFSAHHCINEAPRLTKNARMSSMSRMPDRVTKLQNEGLHETVGICKSSLV